MKITLPAGNTVNVLARVWTGDHWELMPERVMVNDHWWIINYLISSVVSNTMYQVNMTDTFHATTQVSSHWLFNGASFP